MTDIDINAVRKFAVKAHGDQLYGIQHYSVHLDMVASLVPEEMKPIAYLHDVLEDTNISADELEKHFGSYVRKCVELISDPPGKNRKERKRLLHERLAAAEEPYNGALVVKAADRLANIKSSLDSNLSLLTMYRKEHDAFKKAVYREGLCDELWKRMDSLLDTNGLIDKVILALRNQPNGILKDEGLKYFPEKYAEYITEEEFIHIHNYIGNFYYECGIDKTLDNLFLETRIFLEKDGFQFIWTRSIGQGSVLRFLVPITNWPPTGREWPEKFDEDKKVLL